MPEGMEAATSLDIFSIPPGDVSEVIFSRRNLPRARETISSDLTGAVSLHRLGERYWLAAEMPPSALWPLIRNYWQHREIEIALENPTNGTVTTALLTALLPDQANPLSLQLTVESGLRSGSSEVHMSVLDEEGEELNHPPLIEEYLRDLLGFLSKTSDIASSMLVQHLDFITKMQTGSDRDGYPYIELKVEEARAWSLLVKAVRALGLDLVGSDRKQRSISFDYEPEIIRQTSWQTHWDEHGWKEKMGVSAPRMDSQNKALQHTDAADDLLRLHLQLQCEAALPCRIQLRPSGLSINSSFELISRLVQEIQ